ncbi:MAG: DUF4214 domain-containing protein, partial [Rhodothermales bacterium]|nr:DUF4214 domain-containing protein [Rhodothermales bacterium]
LYGTGQTSGRTYLATDLVTDTITANDVGLTGQAILRGPSAAEFIDGLYFNILGRAPDPAGRAFWIQQYNNRVEQQTAKGSINPENDARAFIIDRFVDAEEFENNIGSYLVQFLNGAGQDPDPENLYADPANLAAAGSLGNDAPELLDVIARVEENSPAGTVVATLEVFDRDFNDSGTFSISDPTGNFEIDGDKIVVGPSAALDFETQNSYVVQITATDVGPVGGSGLSDTEEVTITILDVDENVAPTLVTSAGTVLENSDAGTRVTTLVSTDPDTGDTPFYLIESDASGLFDINGDELVVRAGADIDFEQSPSHDVSIRVTDSRGAFSTSTLTVQIADVNEAPSLLTAPGSIQENAAAGEVAASFAVSDPDADDTFSVTLADPSGLFELTAANNIVVKSDANIDFETASSHTVTLTATDASNLSAVKDVVINVADVVEAQNITLTSSADTPSPSSQGVNTLGGAGPELYSGILRINDSNSTINSNDIIDGADGEDTLDIRILGTPSNNRILELTTMNVEKIQFRIQPGNENGFATVDMTTAENVEELWLKDSPGDENSNGNVFLQVNNLNPSNLEFIGLENVQGNFFVNLTGQSGRSNSDNDAFNLSLNGAKNQNDAIFFLLNTDSGTDTTFEIVNIFSTGSESEVEFFDPLDLTHVNVTGDAQLTLSEFKDNPGEGFETLKSVDASGMTGGGLDINAVLASASDFSFIGSGFDDVLLVSR